MVWFSTLPKLIELYEIARISNTADKKRKTFSTFFEMEPSRKKLRAICDHESSSGKRSAQTEKNLSLLPDIVLLKIFSNLPYFPDVFHNISSVCKRFNSFCNDAFLPHQLIIDSGMLKEKNLDQTFKTVERASQLRYLQFDMLLKPYVNELNFTRTGWQLNNLLRILSEKKTLKILKIGCSDSEEWMADWNIPLNNSEKCALENVIRLCQNNKLNVVEVNIPLEIETLVQILLNIRTTIRSIKFICYSNYLQDKRVLDLLTACSLIKSIYIDFSDSCIPHEITQCLVKLASLKNLKVLVLSSQSSKKVSAQDLSLTFLHQIQSLHLRNLFISDTCCERILSNCNNLKEFSADFSEINLDGLLQKSSLPKYLDKLLLTNIAHMSDNGMIEISKSCYLQEIHLSVLDINGLTPKSIFEAFSCNRLRKINTLVLDFPIINDSCVKVIAESCKLLEVFKIKGCENVTDAGIKYLASNCPYLRVISLKRCRNIGDHGIYQLIVACAHLKILEIKYTNVSKKFCSDIFSIEREIMCNHRNCVNYHSDLPFELLDVNNYEDDSYSFKDYRYRR